MSDHNPRDIEPIDEAYAKAEAMLSDEAGRAARRAKVLAAVAEAPAAPLADAAPRRSPWRNGGWLVAASVAGLAVMVAIRMQPPVQIAPPAAKARAPHAPMTTAPLEPAPPVVLNGSSSIPPPSAARAAADVPSVQPLPVPPVEHRRAEPGPVAAQPATRASLFAAAPPAASPASPDAPPPPAAASAQDLVVTAQKIAPAPAPAPRARQKAAPSASTVEEMVVTTDHRALTGSPPERLRAAAERGRTGDIEALLANGVDVDAADAEGETPLMKAVQADQTAAAALLRRQGASLKRKNHAGASALDMAAAVGDPELDRALGIRR